MTMRTTFAALMVCVSFLSKCVALFNSSDVSVSTANSPLPLNTTTIPPNIVAMFHPNCTAELSCQGKCSKSPEQDSYPNTGAHCHCDEACRFYQDCCADYVDFCGTKAPATETPPVIGRNQAFDCIKLTTDVDVLGVFMIASCPADWKDETTRQKCLAGLKPANRSLSSKTIKEHVPVVDLFTSLHYRNIYCGLCNKFSSMAMQYWKLKIRCNIRPSIHFNATQALDFLLKYCPIRNLEPLKGLQVRSCLPTVSTCSISKITEHHEGCLKGPSGLMYTKLTLQNYKNYHCLLCNGLPINSSTCGPKTSGQIFDPRSFEIVMDFDTTSHQETETIKQETTTACATDHVYDPHLETCRKGFVANPSHAIRDKYRIKVWMAPSDDKTHSFSPEEFRNVICATFAFQQSQVDEIKMSSEDSSTAVEFNLYAGKFPEIVPTTGGPDVHPKPLDVSFLLNFQESFQMTISKVMWVVLRATQRQLACVQSDIFGPQEFRILPTAFAEIIKTKEQFSPSKFFFVQNKNTEKSLLVCKSKFTVWCPFVLLPVGKSEYKRYPNKTLLHITTGMMYKTGEYDLEKDTAWICTNYTKVLDGNSSVHYNFTDFNNTVVIRRNRTVKSKIVVTKTESVVLRYFTIVGFSISILSLMLTLSTHFIFQELRGPLPGKNLMSLCLALLLFQFTWLFGSGDTDKPVFCTVIAATLHFLILVSFSCTAVIAFDTRRTFSSKISKAPGRSLGQVKTLRFLAYSGLAWGVPLLFVVGCVLLDKYNVVFIGYGNEEACWLVNVNAKIIAFAAPIACVLLYNVAAFSHTVWVINSARKQTARAKSSRQDQQAVFKIYVRLVTLMGFSWFFSFSAELIHKALLYPFVVFTTTQGVYIFVAFICKTRVLKLLKDKVRKSKRGIQMSIQNTGSTELRSSSPYTPYKPNKETNM